MQIYEPKTEQELEAHHQLVQEVLRKTIEPEEESGLLHLSYQDGKVLGALTASKEMDEIIYLAVERNSRNERIGSKLLSALEQKAKQNQIKTISVDADENTYWFFDKNGYTFLCRDRQKLIMKKELEGIII